MAEPMFTVPDLLAGACAARPHKTFLVDGRQRLSFAELDALSDRGAHLMRSQYGVEPGDRVGIASPNGILDVFAMFSVLKAGGIFVMVHPKLKVRQVAYIAEDCRPQVLLVNQSAGSRYAKVPQVRQLVVIEQLFASCRSDARPGDANRVALPNLIGEDIACLVYTSGSTGSPKGIILSHANLVKGARIVAQYLHNTEDDVLLGLLPLNFDYGLNQLLTMLLSRGTLVTCRAFFANDVVRLLQDEQVTGLAGIPPIWAELYGQRSLFPQNEFPHLRYITNSGGSIPASILDRMIDHLGHQRIVLMYGLTEAFRSTYLPPELLPAKKGSLGKAIPDVEIMVLSPQGRPCRPFEHGELVHRGGVLSRGYWNDLEKTRAVFRPHPFSPPGLADPEIVVYSGDIVFRDQDGYLFFVERKDTQIKCQGFRVSPGEIEEQVYATGLVDGCAVVALDDDRHGAILVLFVVPNGRCESIDTLQFTLKQSLPSYMLPKVVTTVETLPSTATGKVDYPVLKRRALEEVGRAGTGLPAASQPYCGAAGELAPHHG